jgi:hypothetical protein
MKLPIEAIINLASNVIAKLPPVAYWIDKAERKQRRKDKERAGLLVCGRCKQITTLNACGLAFMEDGKSPDMTKECAALD